MRLEVVIVRVRLDRAGFARKLCAERPQALFVDPINGRMWRGDAVVEARGIVIRCALSLACGAVISPDEMADWEFSGRRDGGPDYARELMQIAMMEARAALAALGYLTASQYRRGFSAKAAPVAAE